MHHKKVRNAISVDYGFRQQCAWSSKRHASFVNNDTRHCTVTASLCLAGWGLPWRQAESAVCGLRIADADPQLDSRTGSERIFLFRGRHVAIAMNSVNILHAVRSASTAITELLVFFRQLGKGQNPLYQFPRSKSVTSWRLIRLTSPNKSAR